MSIANPVVKKVFISIGVAAAALVAFVVACFALAMLMTATGTDAADVPSMNGKQTCYFVGEVYTCVPSVESYQDAK